MQQTETLQKDVVSNAFFAGTRKKPQNQHCGMETDNMCVLAYAGQGGAEIKTYGRKWRKFWKLVAFKLWEKRL